MRATLTETQKIALHQIAQSGKSKTLDSTSPESAMDSACRAVMRNPSNQAQELIQRLKSCMNNFFSAMTDEQILWINNCISDSRGSFATGKAIRTFCQSGIDSMSISAQITLLDHLLTAINYASASSNATTASELLASTRCAYLWGRQSDTPPYIGDRFPMRKEQLAKRVSHTGLTEEHLNVATEIEKGTYFIAPRRSLSNASFNGISDVLEKPKKNPKRQVFKTPHPRQPAEFITLAKQAGVPVIGHISGTIPNNLAIAHNLLKTQEMRQSPSGLSNEEAIILSGLIAASFQRSGFHSPIETLIGLEYFLAFRQKRKLPQPQSVAEMKKWFKHSIALLAHAANEPIRLALTELINVFSEHPELNTDETVGTNESSTAPQEAQEEDDQLWKQARAARQAYETTNTSASSVANAAASIQEITSPPNSPTSTLEIARTFATDFQTPSDAAFETKPVAATLPANMHIIKAMEAAIKVTSDTQKINELCHQLNNYKCASNHNGAKQALLNFILRANMPTKGRFFTAKPGNTSSAIAFHDEIQKHPDALTIVKSMEEELDKITTQSTASKSAAMP